MKTYILTLVISGALSSVINGSSHQRRTSQECTPLLSQADQAEGDEHGEHSPTQEKVGQEI